MVLVTGVAMVSGGLAVVFGFWMDHAALGIAIFVMAAGLLMHRFWEETDDQTRQVETAQFMKNISIAGAAFISLSVSEHAPYTLTDGGF